ICVYFFSSRSSAAWAKKALADFRISLARRSSRFSFSSALRRSRSSVVTPDRIPRSTSDRLIQASRVVGVQPIFGAIDSIAAHSDRYSSRCSCTRRTARSRTSGENLLFLLMAPFSQEMKPPQNPGRFKLIFEQNKKNKSKTELVDEVRRMIRASLGNRAKESLVVDFINQTDLDQIGDKASVIEAFFNYAQVEQKREAEALIAEENLNSDAARRYLSTSLRREYASEQGTALNELLPKMSPL